MQHVPLELARLVTQQAEDAWTSGELIEHVSPTTKTLLTHWFDEAHTEIRQTLNFHTGQRQAILNTIYLHEVLKTQSVLDVYESIATDLLALGQVTPSQLTQPKYQHPKYAIKMATGTGKTWVMQALLVWQYLNSRHSSDTLNSIAFSRNFLIVAPGLIVYERLLDAFLGKLDSNGTRDFATADLFRYQELFLPDGFRDEVLGFIQSAVADKEEIGSKVTGDGLIAITNYHLLSGVEDQIVSEEEIEEWFDAVEAIRQLLPLRPGSTAGNSLEALDGANDQRAELEYLRNLTDLVVFNDEAHHIHEIRGKGEATEVEWQRSLSYICEPKANRFIQFDFSATPYNERAKRKEYFPHIICDFDLTTAIREGLVKTLVLDERKEIAVEELNFKAERDDSKKVVRLSDGQQLMLRAGLRKLEILRKSFMQLTAEPIKFPKMLVVCEDTNVVPLVAHFLQEEGLLPDDILEVHSNRKNEIGADEWGRIKDKLSALDRYQSLQVVISVLMLREGFDVNNICVIVPLRSSQSGVLLEQTIGRGLRQMWREPEFQSQKQENRRLLFVEKRAPKNYFDILTIIEHPAFRSFYDELINLGVLGFDGDIATSEGVLDDMLTVGLKPNYREFDFGFPVIHREADEVIRSSDFDVSKLRPYPVALEHMVKYVPKTEVFGSTEITAGTRYGDYAVGSGLLTSTSFNDYLGRLVDRVVHWLNTSLTSAGFRGKSFPSIQINLARLAAIADEYLSYRLFATEEAIGKSDAWRVLLHKDVATHLIEELCRVIQEMQETETVAVPQVTTKWLSEVDQLLMRESKSIATSKTIYERTGWPSNKGGLEQAFIEYADTDDSVHSFAKIVEHKHTFVRIRYLRSDSLLAHYHPDFMLRCGDAIYLVETKAQDQVGQANVQRKKVAAVRWTERVNALPAELRSDATWHYCLLGEEAFYLGKNTRQPMVDMLSLAALRSMDESARLSLL